MKLEGYTIYVIHGWKVEGDTLERCLINLNPEVIEIGMRLVFPKDRKYGFFGEILSKTEDDFSECRVVVPSAGAAERLAHALLKVGLDKMSMEAPLLWVVAG